MIKTVGVVAVLLVAALDVSMFVVGALPIPVVCKALSANDCTPPVGSHPAIGTSLWFDGGFLRMNWACVETAIPPIRNCGGYDGLLAGVICNVPTATGGVGPGPEIDVEAGYGLQFVISATGVDWYKLKGDTPQVRGGVSGFNATIGAYVHAVFHDPQSSPPATLEGLVACG